MIRGSLSIATIMLGVALVVSRSATADRAAGETPGGLQLKLDKYWEASEHAPFGRVQLAYLSNDRLAISFPTRNRKPELSSRLSRRNGTYLFKTVFVDPHSGVVAAQHEWGDYHGSNELLSVANGRFVVIDEDAIQLYGHDVELIAVHPLEKVKKIPHFKVFVSPSGHRVYVFQPGEPGTDNVIVLDTGRLNLVAKLTVPSGLIPSVNEDGIVYKASGTESQFVKLLLSGKKSIISLPGSVSCGNVPTFISESRLVISGGCPSLVLINANGEMIKKINIDRRTLGTITPVNKSIFCTETYDFRKGNAALDISPSVDDPHLICLDALTLSATADIPLTLAHQDHVGPTVAVAPDASTIAMYTRQAVSIIPLNQAEVPVEGKK